MEFPKNNHLYSPCTSVSYTSKTPNEAAFVCARNSKQAAKSPSFGSGTEAYSPILNHYIEQNVSANLYQNDTSDIEGKFKEVELRQGIVGKAWNAIKNKFNFKSSSKNLNKTIELYKNGQVTKDVAAEALNKYITSQTKALDFVADCFSTAVGAIMFGKIKNLKSADMMVSFMGAGVLGGCAKVSVKSIDAAFGERKYKTFAYDAVTGFINGLISPLVNSIGNIATRKTAVKLGANSVDKFSNAALKPMNILEGLVFYPKQKVQGTAAQKAASYSVGRTFRGTSKLLLASVIRNVSFKLASMNSLMKGGLLTMGIYSFDEKQKEKFHISSVDFSNDVYDTDKIED